MQKWLAISRNFYRSSSRGFRSNSPQFTKMATINKFEAARSFESETKCSLDCWIVIRVDGKCFHRFSDVHKFVKPNDENSLRLMARSATNVMREFNDICLAYGQSDEFSFVLRKDCTLFERRASKLLSNVCSAFSSSYVFYWNDFFPQTQLRYPPIFDSRVVVYPNDDRLREYLSWRQTDCHINNLYNTTFWALIQKGNLSPTEAEEKLRGTLSKDKNEILFSEFGINYNNEPELFRKGTVIVRKKKEPKQKKNKQEKTECFDVLNVDIIGSKFWEENSHVLCP